MTLPTFIIGGAPRSGTTLLYHILEDHPDVFLARPCVPEPKFFLVDDEYERGLQYYEEQWFDTAQTIAIGEKSANYLESAIVAERIFCNLPGIRLVFMLRDPVERAFSNYLWSRKNGLETMSFEAAIESERERELGYPAERKFSRPFSYMSRGMYAAHLQSFLRLFPESRIHVIVLEELLARKNEVVDRLLRFLGVAPRHAPHDFSSPVNSAWTEGLTMTIQAREFLEQVFREPNEALEDLLRRSIDCWPVSRKTRSKGGAGQFKS